MGPLPERGHRGSVWPPASSGSRTRQVQGQDGRGARLPPAGCVRGAQRFSWGPRTSGARALRKERPFPSWNMESVPLSVPAAARDYI